jgi:hypothetical protein
MPCPFFEPQQPAHPSSHTSARLPLLEEYDGLCHATGEATAIPKAIRFRGCNHGNQDERCSQLPQQYSREVLRFTVLKTTDTGLELLVVHEADHVPVRWESVSFCFSSQQLHPDFIEICKHAQVLAFCRSYQKRCVPSG